MLSALVQQKIDRAQDFGQKLEELVYRRRQCPAGDREDPYSEAQLRGRVVERRRDSDFKLLDGISRKYVGKPYPDHSEAPIALMIEINKARYSKEPFEHS